jgi:hypothetical protein
MSSSLVSLCARVENPSALAPALVADLDAIAAALHLVAVPSPRRADSYPPPAVDEPLFWRGDAHARLVAACFAPRPSLHPSARPHARQQHVSLYNALSASEAARSIIRPFLLHSSIPAGALLDALLLGLAAASSFVPSNSSQSSTSRMTAFGSPTPSVLAVLDRSRSDADSSNASSLALFEHGPTPRTGAARNESVDVLASVLQCHFLGLDGAGGVSIASCVESSDTQTGRVGELLGDLLVDFASSFSSSSPSSLSRTSLLDMSDAAVAAFAVDPARSSSVSFSSSYSSASSMSASTALAAARRRLNELCSIGARVSNATRGAAPPLLSESAVNQCVAMETVRFLLDPALHLGSGGSNSASNNDSSFVTGENGEFNIAAPSARQPPLPTMSLPLWRTRIPMVACVWRRLARQGHNVCDTLLAAFATLLPRSSFASIGAASASASLPSSTASATHQGTPPTAAATGASAQQQPSLCTLRIPAPRNTHSLLVDHAVAVLVCAARLLLNGNSSEGSNDGATAERVWIDLLLRLAHYAGMVRWGDCFHFLHFHASATCCFDFFCANS